MFWGSLWTLLGCFSKCWGRATAKIPKTVDLMTFCMDLLSFKGPKGSEMRFKWSLRREKRGEKREKSREEREESATKAKRKVLDPRNCLRFQGPGVQGSKIGYPGTPDSYQGVGL